MRAFYREYPDAFLFCEKDGELIGVAFGRDRSVQFPDDDSFELCGIAIRYDHQRNGYGRALLAEFEKSAKAYGAKAVSLGSAEGYAEKFYISCGYMPSEYKAWENGAPWNSSSYFAVSFFISITLHPYYQGYAYQCSATISLIFKEKYISRCSVFIVHFFVWISFN